MVTQFGYIVVWSCVWPLAPVFALLNNYFEIRGDVVKITQHVRRPVGDRVETIGSWLDTLVCPFFPLNRLLTIFTTPWLSSSARATVQKG